MLAAALTFSVAVAAIPTLAASDEGGTVEVQGVVIEREEERARSGGTATVFDAPEPDAPPLWLFPTLAALAAFLIVTGTAAVLERNPPARF
ncbi:MAG TPA: hypothetical protein VI854_03875 [Acidimicrobiia bacterium]|nr:hypothetical protein [Acidimicrobiia bacterium]